MFIGLKWAVQKRTCASIKLQVLITPHKINPITQTPTPPPWDIYFAFPKRRANTLSPQNTEGSDSFMDKYPTTIIEATARGRSPSNQSYNTPIRKCPSLYPLPKYSFPNLLKDAPDLAKQAKQRPGEAIKSPQKTPNLMFQVLNNPKRKSQNKTIPHMYIHTTHQPYNTFSKIPRREPIPQKPQKTPKKPPKMRFFQNPKKLKSPFQIDPYDTPNQKNDRKHDPKKTKNSPLLRLLP